MIPHIVRKSAGPFRDAGPIRDLVKHFPGIDENEVMLALSTTLDDAACQLAATGADIEDSLPDELKRQKFRLDVGKDKFRPTGTERVGKAYLFRRAQRRIACPATEVVE